MSNSTNTPEKVLRIDSERLAKAAEEQRLSVRAIADKAGDITFQTVHSILKGKTNPSAVNVKRVCDVLGVPFEEAFIEERAAA